MNYLYLLHHGCMRPGNSWPYWFEIPIYIMIPATIIALFILVNLRLRFYKSIHNKPYSGILDLIALWEIELWIASCFWFFPILAESNSTESEALKKRANKLLLMVFLLLILLTLCLGIYALGIASG